MLKSLKSKFTLLYFILIVILTIVGITSFSNISNLRVKINKIMTNNYNSIQAISNMIGVVNSQQEIVCEFVYGDSKNSLGNFYDLSSNFFSWYNSECNHTSENGEKELVDLLLLHYKKYVKDVDMLQNMKISKNKNDLLKFYKETICNDLNLIKKDLNSTLALNENAMNHSKDNILVEADKSRLIILILLISSIISGLLISILSIKTFLKPLYNLTESIKEVKEGNLNQTTPVICNDEIGELTIEFNKMTERLLLFEQSTKGKLLLEKNRSEAIIKSIRDPIIVLNPYNKIVSMNPACENILNINLSNNLNRFFFEAIKNPDLHDFVVSSDMDSKLHSSKIIYFKIEEKDFYFNIIINPIKDNDSSTIGKILLFQNVTSLKNLEKMKQSFISTVSHEFKTPLTSIMIGTSLLYDSGLGSLNDSQHKIVDTIKEDGERLSELVTNLLQLSKIESDQAIFNFKPVHLLGLVSNCIKNFNEISSSKQVNIYYDIDENTPLIKADYEKISWVINNLISNSLKFTNAGDEISIYCSKLNDKMCIYVKDTGIGIPDEYLDKIFNRFVQIKGEIYDGKGTGLGLSIAKEIVEAHGGDIWCESCLDEGSTFIFTIPIYEN